jgi:ferredoxin
MTYVVTENCIKCKFMDCVGVCPVDCFHEGENFLAIDPNECIDCGVCESECPANAILPDSDPHTEGWKELNARYAPTWPVITKKGTSPHDAEEWKDKPDKKPLLSPNAARR